MTITESRPYYEVECECGASLHIACDDHAGNVVDGTGVECPECEIRVYVTCGPQTEPYWQVSDDRGCDVVCAHYCEADGTETMKAT